MILFICPYIFCTVDVSSFVHIDRENWFLENVLSPKAFFRPTKPVVLVQTPGSWKVLDLSVKFNYSGILLLP